MRYIEINDEPPTDWITRANKVTEELLAQGYNDECLKIIERNKQLWGELREWLSAKSNGKCWYTESKDNASYLHVDHFRPKSEVKDINNKKYEGYWWLAFNWRNYRLAGGVSNVPKSSKFPIRPGTDYANSPTDDIDDESPYLLDPTKFEDPGLLSFDNKGEALPSQVDVWHKTRAIVSIEILNLNGHEPLVRARRNHWKICERNINCVLNLLDEISRNESRSKKAELRCMLSFLREMVKKDAEFSAVACVCVRSTANDWLNNVVFM